MESRRIETFEEMWPYYLNEHRLPATRWWHFAATNIALAAIGVGVFTGKLWILPAAIVTAYGMAWFSHFFIERNKPATFTYPLWSFAADIKLWRLMWTGGIKKELDQHIT